VRLTALFLIATALVGCDARTQHAAVRPCGPAVDSGVLPTWARGGFSDRHPKIPHIVGRGGRIVAILFTQPLLSPPRAGRTNKILWAARDAATAADLRITAQRMNGNRSVGDPVHRLVRGGPGPSIVDMPSAGCWRLSLRWANRADSLDLVYRTS
jgi:hypothetical protein